MLKNIPNILTICRILLIPCIIVMLIQEKYDIAIILFISSGITDILDGYVARKFNIVSDIGKLLDPFADKITQISILIFLSLNEMIPIWILLIVLFKEFMMIAGASFLYGREHIVDSKWYGKLSTVIFYIAAVFSMFIRLCNKYYLSEIPNFDIYIYFIPTTIKNAAKYS